MDSLREAMYELIETRDVSEIKVVGLIRKAGVSRGGFYKNYYLVTDVLKDDIKEVSDDVKKAIGPYIENNVVSNWEIILTAVYSYRERFSFSDRSSSISSVSVVICRDRSCCLMRFSLEVFFCSATKTLRVLAFCLICCVTSLYRFSFG